MQINGKEYATAKELAAMTGYSRQHIHRNSDKLDAVWFEKPSGYRVLVFDVELAKQHFKRVDK